MFKKDKAMYAKGNALEYNQNPQAYLRFEETWWDRVLKENPTAKKENYIYKGKILGYSKL